MYPTTVDINMLVKSTCVISVLLPAEGITVTFSVLTLPLGQNPAVHMAPIITTSVQEGLGNNSVRCSFTHCKVNICLNPRTPTTADWFQTTQTAFWWDDFWETRSESRWDLEPWHMGNTIQCIMGQRWFEERRRDRSNPHRVTHTAYQVF